MNKHQYGFTIFELLLVIIFLVLIVSGGLYVYHEEHNGFHKDPSGYKSFDSTYNYNDGYIKIINEFISDAQAGKVNAARNLFSFTANTTLPKSQFKTAVTEALTKRVFGNNFLDKAKISVGLPQIDSDSDVDETFNIPTGTNNGNLYLYIDAGQNNNQWKVNDFAVSGPINTNGTIMDNAEPSTKITLLGQSVVGSGYDAGLSVTIKNIITSPSYTGSAPSAGNHYVEVDFKVKNLTKQTQELDDDFFYLTPTGKLLEDIYAGNGTDVELSGNNEGSLGDNGINPGQTQIVNTIFGLPVDYPANQGKIIWYDNGDKTLPKLATFDLM